MEQAVIAFILLILGYLFMDEFRSVAPPSFDHGRRLCEYRCPGVTFQSVSAALARGIRLVEVHVYSDSQDRPVVALRAGNKGDTVSFESVCVTLVNEAFPSPLPMILSIVPHTSTTFTLNKIAHDLSTTLHKKFLKTDEAVEGMLLGALADKLIIVSGPEVRGSNLEPLVNLSWGGSGLRRLEYAQAVHPRDPTELVEFNTNHISLVAPDITFDSSGGHDNVYKYGCQWNLFARGGETGFVPM
ncbi:MAG: phosphatidylinositol-specific phospholipase C domain-containing protein [Microbacteriaceae bacterium]|nr:phosphatidylinositol-specific phospholipase C domain-containing protein [Microbacteriaceae bacterium]